MIKVQLLKLINVAFAQTAYQPVLATLETPKQRDHGDFATPICFALAKSFRKAPKEIAIELCEFLNTVSDLQGVLEAVPLNGFINFKLFDAFIWSSLLALDVKAPSFPSSSGSILLEYVSANPTGPLHIGHGRWAVLGSVMTHLLRYTKHRVVTEFYVNDAGNQVTTFYDSVEAVKLGNPIPEAGYHGAYIQQLASLDQDPLTAMIDRQRTTLARLGVTFDEWFSEKTLYDKVEVTIERLKLGGWTYERDGAIWFSASQLGDEKDRVLVKADGSYTYFAVDSVYHDNKLQRGFTQLINIWGADHHGYVARINAVIKALSKTEDPINLIVIIGQLVSLMRDGAPVRMSKRTGDMIELDEVIDEIGVDATRYFLIEHRADTHLEFDLTLAKTQSSDNPVYYIQYAYARSCRILEKCDHDRFDFASVTLNELTQIEHQLILLLVQWPDIAWSAAVQRQPYQISAYCLKVARLFHSFYEQCPIMNADAQQQAQRIAILLKFQEIFQQIFGILGISAPRQM